MRVGNHKSIYVNSIPSMDIGNTYNPTMQSQESFHLLLHCHVVLKQPREIQILILISPSLLQFWKQHQHWLPHVPFCILSTCGCPLICHSSSSTLVIPSLISSVGFPLLFSESIIDLDSLLGLVIWIWKVFSIWLLTFEYYDNFDVLGQVGIFFIHIVSFPTEMVITGSSQ